MRPMQEGIHTVFVFLVETVGPDDGRLAAVCLTRFYYDPSQKTAMSSETQTNTDVTAQEACTACDGTLREKRLALQTYAESDEQAISGLSAGGLLYCPDCAAEPVALLDSWVSHDQPPIESDRAIAAGYREASDC